jgi:hypothetical protein
MPRATGEWPHPLTHSLLLVFTLVWVRPVF